ncbi:AAA protein [Oryctes borbonicus]|uniref:Replication factor C subunit 1 n=1 Tax=Oryctes borbonicus TaxID=1629725 RepID=A0A0T6B3N2_9SCAR|nr:AAA protein [Oryctes borbonicus]
MSQDIRSFFSVIAGKPNRNTVVSTKRRAITIDSSDDEIIAASPVDVKQKVTIKTKKRKIIDSDSDDESKKTKANKESTKPERNKLQKVNAADIFGSTPIKQTKVEKKETHHDKSSEKTPLVKHKTKSKAKTPLKLETELGIHDDPEFEQVLLDLDNDILLNNVNALDKTVEEALNNPTNSMSTHKRNTTTPKRKSKVDEESDELDKDQERYEKRRHSALLYQKYLNRSGPAHHGAKEYPKGKPNCLNGLCFLRTGVLDSLEGGEFDQLVKDHGGRTVHAVSKKVDYVVEGVEPGPAKLEKARKYGIPSIGEDTFLDLILTKSGMKPKYAKGASTGDSANDSNIEECHADTKTSSPKVAEKSQKDTGRTNASPKKLADRKIEDKEATKPIITKLSSDNNDIPKVTIINEYFYGKRTPEVIVNEKEIVNISVIQENLSWADKYKPTDIKSIIGQQGDRSCMRKLLYWLSKWHENHSGKGRPKIPKPSPWSKTDDGAYFKCALLSGPPGIGKTTTATLVAKELEFDVVEFNASDTRSKRLLHEQVAQLLSTNSIAGFVKEGTAPTKKHVLLMDEVDGMAGNEDRGGMQELIQLIKNTSIPIICMCNDRNHAKVRSLANYCFDLRFSKPRLEQIKGAMMSVCFKEDLKIKPETLTQIISGTGMDVRQTLNHLSMWTVNNKSLSVEEAQKEANAAQKDTILGPWEVLRKVFSQDEHKTMSVADRFRLFYYDYSIGPLFVQENYLQVQPNCPRSETLQRVSWTADSISKSDLVDKKMRSSNNWSLLEVQAIYSSVLPGQYMEGNVRGQINFPTWLGKNSKKGKFKRLVSELQAHMRISTSGSRKSVNLDYIYHLRNCIIKPLRERGTNGIEKAMEVMHSYNLLREDLDGIMEVSHWSRQKDPMAMVDSKVKAAFTRAYNKDNAKLPYSASSAAIKKKAHTAVDDNPYEEEEEGNSAAEDDDDITKDAMIKAKKKPVKGKDDKTEASTSKKGSSSTRGKGTRKK